MSGMRPDPCRSRRHTFAVTGSDPLRRRAVENVYGESSSRVPCGRRTTAAAVGDAGATTVRGRGRRGRGSRTVTGMSASIGPGLRLWRAALRHPQLSDAALGAVIMALVLGATVIGGDDHESRALHGGDFAAAAAGLVLITARRRWPVPVLIVASLATAAAMLDIALLPQFAAATLVCLYTVATKTRRITAWSCAVAAAAVGYVSAVLVGGAGWAQPETVTVVAWAGMAIAIGDVVRTRRAYLEAVLERARHAEHTREEEARRRVMEERLRIARELHDVLAHNIALINFQAGVASQLLDRNPAKAQQSLAEVRQAARTVLDELSTVLGVLRAPDEPTDGTEEPPPGLNRLDDLLRTFQTGGLRVEHTREGAARHLPASVDHAAYRILQEALTNAHKHGAGGIVRLRVAYTGQNLDLSVENPQPPQPSPPSGGTGYGLIGVRERAAAVGGTVTVGADGTGTFRVNAQLPAAPMRNAL